MKINVKFFASCREIAGKTGMDLQAEPGETVAGILKKVRQACPGLPDKDIMIAVNQEFVTPDYKLREGDEVALIPPVSGG